MSKAIFYHAPVKTPKVYGLRRRVNAVAESRAVLNRPPATPRARQLSSRRVALARMPELK